jgi:uncharacterized protein YjbI with pentapeptide repeats
MRVNFVELLSSYIAWISDLAVQGNLSDPENLSIKDVARARTLATLRMIQPEHKTILLKFLYEAGLLGRQNGEKAKPIIALNGADLKGVNLSHYQMEYIVIISAFLNEANLSNAFLFQANLGACDLINADLSFATLDEANLLMADLTGANLKGASMLGTTILDEQLSKAACTEGLMR